MTILVRVLMISLMTPLTAMLQAGDENGAAANMATDAAMQEAMKRGSPGENHQALAPFTGQFTTISRMWMEPGTTPQESTGTARHDWVLGGRFLRMDVQGDMGGHSFQGIGYLGFDNVRGEYVGTWLDSMNTGIMQASGRFNNSTRTLSETGSFSCPMTNEKDMRFRGEWQVIDDNNLSYTMYQPDPDGAEFKVMEIKYKRVK